jgi:prevent-host-death family protein
MTYSVEEFRKNRSDILGRVHHAEEQVTITRHGKRYAVVISVDRLEDLETMEEASDAHAAHEAINDSSPISNSKK